MIQPESLVQDWVFCFGSPDNPSRRISLLADRRIFNFVGEERFWTLTGSLLLLLDARRVINWIFDTSTADSGSMRGRPRQSDYLESPVWLVRPDAFLSRRAGQRRMSLIGPLDAQANSHADFLSAWRSNEDFSVVLAPAANVLGIRPKSFSRNLGSGPHADKFVAHVEHYATSGFPCMPVFFHVLHDCLLVDGSVAVTRDGKVVNETTQFRGFDTWDTDFMLIGSGSDQGLPEICVSEGTETVLDLPIFLFNTVRNSYGHWLGQSLTNAVFLDWIRDADASLAETLILSIMSGVWNEDFRTPGLQLLDLTNPVIAPPKGLVRCKRLIVPSFHRCHSIHWPGICGVFQKMVSRAKLLAPDAPSLERIYASRSGQTRSFTSEAAVKAVLEKHHFTPLIGGTLPYAEQVAIYGSAEAIFGSFGSNMCNMSFCRPGTLVLEAWDEFLPEPYWDYFLANASKLDYSYIITAVPNEQRSLGFFERTVDLDPEILDEVLRIGLAA